MELPQRPRRNRRWPSLRSLVRENELGVCDLVMPLFVIAGQNKRESIKSMPGIERLSTDLIVAECESLLELGVRAVALFPALTENEKDRRATESANPQGLYPRTIQSIKERLPEMLVIGDVAMDPYSSDGHDGLLDEQGIILNDETLPILGEMALCQAEAGVDLVAPSDMMDGRVAYLRECLDQAGFKETGILAYTAKYASSFYGPFREALDSAPRAGDKKTYQMDPANVREALREMELDLAEGADIVMVKPGLPYLDVVRALAEVSSVPVAVYNVSGEYAMLRAAAQNGWLDYEKCVSESLLAFKRAGADIILTYHAREVAGWLKRDNGSVA
ncbi:MAG: porphobilinogen synthase [Spirochaetales bacterium]|nr:porphobilinogen synthase [Leptospiraceae bacterium]MCP5481070.1 porphobilinogen synthase [Spirochaetales bacterium]MCP5485450.1 porphobilinogen synthase [Spirochaetales bacterium]